MTDKKLNAEQIDDTNDANALTWSCHPVKRKPLLSVGVTVLVSVIVALVYNTAQSVWFGLLAFVVMLLSLAKFYLPTHYKLTAQGIVIKTTTQTLKKHWKEYRSAYPDNNGILLSPFVEPSRLENFRGLYLMFNNNRSDVISYVNAHIGKQTDDTQNGVKS